MRITIRNNPRGKANNDLIKRATLFYFNRLGLEPDKFRGQDLIVRFKRLPGSISGRAKWRSLEKVYYIELEKCLGLSEALEVLAHECCHIKQYLKKELITKRETVFIKRRGFVRRKVRIWKGKEIRRSQYYKRPWEVEARRSEKLSGEFEISLKSKPQAEPKPEPKPEVARPELSVLQAQIIGLVRAKDILPNGDLISHVLKGNRDKQFKIRVHKAVFELKQKGYLEEVNQGGLVFVRTKI